MLGLAVRHAVMLVVARVPVGSAVEWLRGLLLVVLLLSCLLLLLLLLGANAAAKLRGSIFRGPGSRHGLLGLLVLLLLVATVVVLLLRQGRSVIISVR